MGWKFADMGLFHIRFEYALIDTSGLDRLEAMTP